MLESGHRRIPMTALSPYKAKLAPLEAVDAAMAKVGLDLTDAEIAEEMRAHAPQAP